MLTRTRLAVAAAAAALAFAAPLAAQQRAGVMGEILKDVGDVRTKFVGLAKEMPADKHGWRPAPGVRSASEVLLHVASDNYLLPSIIGVAPDAATGIKSGDFASAVAFEKQAMSRDAMVAAVEKSFAHLAKAMADTPDAKLDDKIKFFGQEMTVRQLWLVTATHLHEHLGQAIAYARSNGVVPPWSRPAGG